MADEPKSFVKAEFSEIGHTFQFETPDDLDAWIKDLRERWKSTLDSTPVLPRAEMMNFDIARTSVRNVLNSGAGLVETDTRETRGAFLNALQAAFVTARLPLPSAPFPEFLDQLRVSHGASAAAAAFATQAPYNNNIKAELSHPATRIGTISATLFELGVDTKTPAAMADRLLDLAKEQEAKIQALSQRIVELDSATKTVTETAISEAESQRAAHENAQSEAMKLFGAASAEAIGELKATQAAFIEHMHLSAPVTYWTKKGKEHRLSERRIRWSLVGYLCIGSFALFLALSSLTSWADEAVRGGNIAIYVKYAAIALLVIAIALWTARILLRFLISERHLAIDAEERVTMVMTYLALTKEGTIEASDRALVLGPLFRSGSDGIVRDDGMAPDTMFTALAGKALDRATKS